MKTSFFFNNLWSCANTRIVDGPSTLMGFFCFDWVVDECW